jgi:peptidyl-prolyl cis-trans isomerase C
MYLGFGAQVLMHQPQPTKFIDKLHNRFSTKEDPMFFQSRLAVSRSLALILFGVSALSAARAADTEAVAATVNGQPISKRQVDAIMKQQAERGMPDTPDTRKSVIENIALQKLVAQEAIKKGLDKKDDVADQLELTRQGVLAQGFVGEYMKSNPVSEAAVLAEYEKVKTSSGGKELSARHILVDKEADAKAIIVKLKKDANQFAALAKAQSKDTGSKERGGDLGWFDPASMVPEFSAAAAKLEKGKFTDVPVKSQFGFHVIQLIDTRSKPAPSLDELRPRIAQQLQQQSLKKVLDEMKAKAKIEIVAAAVPATAGGVAAPAAPKK